MQAAYRTISHIGGKLMLFSASACTIAAAPTKSRDAPAHYNSDREAALRNPADPFFNAFASECIAAQICVDIFAASSQYLDLFSLSTLPRSTGAPPFVISTENLPLDVSRDIS
jgi:protein transport protein SEC24